MATLAILIAILGFYIIYVHNRALSWELKVSNSWSQISVQLKAKINIIPNLVEVAERYAKYEKDLFTSIAENRQNLINSESSNENIKNNSELTRNINRLYAVAEAYPDLKANETFLNLQNKITDIEDKIAAYRQFYNDTVMLYNRFIQTFPHNLIARLFGHKEIEYLKFDVEDN